MPVDPAFIAGLPKAELHVHHVGSASPRIVSELARRHPGTVPDDPEELRRFFEFRDFAHFIEVYLAVVDLVRTPEDVRVLTYEVAREMATEQSLRYAELTCTPYTSVRPHEDGVGMPIEAYTEALMETSTDRAPWYVIPADRKWYRNWAILTVLNETMARLDPQFPPEESGLDDIVIT